MLSLSKKTDYGLLALSHLAQAGDGRAVSAKEIAERYDIPMALLAKILQKLARADLVASTPGARGGYQLARPAEAISIAAVIEAIDGPMAITHCLKDDHSGCEQLGKCTIRSPLESINARITLLLNHISLAELSDREAPARVVLTGPRLTAS